MKRASKTLLSLLRVGVGVGLLCYVLASTGSWRFAGDLMWSPRLAVILVLCVGLGPSVEARRLGLLLRSQGIELPTVRGLRLVSIATFFGAFVPGGTGGDLAKLYALGGKRPGQRVEVALVLFVDRAVGFLSLVTLVVFFAVWNWRLLQQQALLRYLVGTAFLIGTGLISAVIFSWSDRLRSGRLYEVVRTRLPGGRYAARVWDALYAFRSHRAALAAGLGLSLLGHIGLCGIFLLVGTQVMPAAPMPALCLLGLLGMLANGLPITPGGIGVGEAAFAALFALAGYSGGSALILAWRLGTLPVCIAGGLLFLAGFDHTPHSHASQLAEESSVRIP